MIAFQKYCQLHQSKIMGFTIFIGIIAAMMLLAAGLGLAKHGLGGFSNDMFTTQMIAIPLSFLVLLMLHKIFNLYQQGHFFAPQVLQIYRAIAQLALYYALVIKPTFFTTIAYFSPEPFDSFSSLYLMHTEFLLAIVAYTLNLVAGVTKLSREIEQEQELTI